MDKEELKKIFSYEICKRRLEKGWTQDKLAEVANISKASVIVYEHRKGLPTTSALCKLADAFDCTVDELLGRR